MPIHQPHAQEAGTIDVRPQFSQGGELPDVPRFELPRHEMPADSAYQIVHDELMLDGNARLNLATFVTTWMEPAARVLMAECQDKNMIDKDEYPRTAELERRCVAMLADLWGAPATRSPQSAARRRAPARPPCSAAWRSSAAGRSGAAPRASRTIVPTS